ncbi:epsilon subunit of F1F0-ATP synthase N-terminal domain-containing protein [Aureobasidium pullulans]|uniref:ATP synthase subunit delta, mitochondrial n=1 Tax=Aureobasidium pullulans TaxID=5580 RepID=A0A4S9XUL2_AURPU|nr:epsilon subunit of F1F0-ATP synthase N-terminal domain-containing protein [Aureobasidium pullulans]
MREHRAIDELAATMNSFRVARAALRVRPTAFAAPLARRGYADVAADKIQLSLSLPHQVRLAQSTILAQSGTRQKENGKRWTCANVNIPAETGDMGVLASHVPSIEQLRPGLVEVIEESAGSKQFFLSGGFATVQPGSKLSINAVEGYPLEDFSAEAVRNQIAEAQKIASGSGSEQDIAEAKIELEVLESLQGFLK